MTVVNMTSDEKKNQLRLEAKIIPKTSKKNRKHFQPWFRPFQSWITLEICSDLFLEKKKQFHQNVEKYFYLKKTVEPNQSLFLLGEKKNL